MLLINFTILKYLIYKLVIIVINHIVFSAQNNKDELCNFLLFQESTFPLCCAVIVLLENCGFL